MKKLNRKEYKKQIKTFRSTHLLAKIQHQWVTFRDEYNKEVLMFVYNSNIIREKPGYAFNHWHCFKIGQHLAKIEFYGYPSITFDHMCGLKINVYGGLSYFTINLNNNFRVLTGNEVNEKYNKLFTKAQNWYTKKFIDNEDRY